MTVDLEGDLRREFDAATSPTSLTFHPESIVRQGNRSIRRHRIVAGGSAAMAVALVAGGASLMTRTHDLAAPQPAASTASTATTGIVRAQTPFMQGSGSAQVEFNRDPSVSLNVKFSIKAQDGRLHEVGRSSAGKPGQKADATWRSAIVDGHPVTIGLLPGSPTNFRATGGGTEMSTGADLKGTGYTMFYVNYTPVRPDLKKPAHPPEFTRLWWTDANGIIDGIEGDHRLTGRVLTLSSTQLVAVVLRPEVGSRTSVFGSSTLRVDGSGGQYDLSAATTDPTGVAVVTGRQPTFSRVLKVPKLITAQGPPNAAGILPAGASDIRVILTTNAVATGLAVTRRLPDGRVVFAIPAEGAQPSNPSKDSIKAVTWTNADGSQGRKNVTQHEN